MTSLIAYKISCVAGISLNLFITSEILGQLVKSQLINSRLYTSEAKTISAIEIWSPAINYLSFKNIVSTLSKATSISFLA